MQAPGPRVLPGLRVEEAGGIWAVRLQIPPDVIADGVQTIVIAEKADGRALDSVALIAGPVVLVEPVPQPNP